LIAYALAVVALALLPLPARAQSPRDLRAQLDEAITMARAADAPRLSPARYAEAGKLYEEADALLRRGAPAEAAREAVQRAVTAARHATASAAAVQGALAELLSARAAVLGLDPSAPDRAARADALLREAARHVEAGDRLAAARIADQALTEYRAIGTAVLRDVKLPATRQTLERLRPTLPESTFTKALEEHRALEAKLRGERLTIADLVAIDAGLAGIVVSIYPPFYHHPPMTLVIDGFTLHVEAYTGRGWDFQNQIITNGTGTAWTSFACAPPIVSPFPELVKKFKVVELVQDPMTEVGIHTARRFAPGAAMGETLELQLPRDASTAFEMAEVIEELLGGLLKPKGDIRVRFENLTIAPAAQSGVGTVLAGQAVYPVTPPPASPARLRVAGFALELAQLVITPAGATATAELEFPVSIVDPGTGHPGRVPLGSFPIAQDCQFRRELPAQAFGPWAVGNTEMLVQGVGVTADFDKGWAPPGAPPGSAAAQPTWRGALLKGGDTVPATERIVSNSGYLRAAYSFADAEVTALGLRGTFTLTAPFTFFTLEPFDYRVRISAGTIVLLDSAVEQGGFQDGAVTMPSRAVRDGSGAPAAATYGRLALDAKLDLQGSAAVTGRIRWGDFATPAGPSAYYEVGDIAFARFYLAGAFRPNYFPIDAAGQFVEPGGSGPTVPVAAGMQGLSLFWPMRFTIFTPDTPGQKPLEFGYGGTFFNEKDASWINVSYDGVHGRVSRMILVGGGTANTDLGPTSEPFYEGKAPFHQSPTPIETDIPLGPAPLKIPHYRILMRFVASATFASDMRGILRIPTPVDADLEFSEMVFTSTAQNAGGKLPLASPLKLSYWGLDMVKEPGAASAGVLSVRTGKVVFTAAGIRELRHFQQPFYLVWGEMRADGGLQRFVFDYNSAGQRFDRFLFTTSFVRLSDYAPGVEAFLKVAGTVHFDFFGPKYLNLQDAYVPTMTGDPFNSRRIDLKADVDPGGAFAATDTQLARNWGNGLGAMSFTYKYDDAAQDGFLGTGQMGFFWVNGQMAAAIVLKAEQICMSVGETTRHDFSLGPIAHLGAMHRITGCACLEDSQLQRATLSAELETQEDANIALRAATYGRVDWMLTPSVTTVEVSGDMYLTVLLGGNIQVTGLARFTVDRALDFVDGEINGRFDTGTALGLGSLSADGQLNWHLGQLGGQSYQSIQGKLAVRVVAPVGGAAYEGGFYIGLNAPKTEAWVLATGGDKFQLNMAPLPARLTGVYGYGKATDSVNLWVFSGGIEVYAGLGGFVLTPQQVIDLGATSTTNVVGLPFVLGNAGVHIWGEILGGLVSAGGWGNFNVIAPYPFSYQGTIGLEGCVAWVVCGSTDVTAGVNSQDGLFVE
jgi:hypothetical protein